MDDRANGVQLLVFGFLAILARVGIHLDPRDLNKLVGLWGCGDVYIP